MEEDSKAESIIANIDKADWAIKTGGKKPARLFRKIWLDVPGFQPWLKYDPAAPTKATCGFCNTSFKARLSTIKDHAITEIHLNNSGLEAPPPPSSFIIPPREESKEERKKAEAELKVLAMCTKLNISYKNVPVLVKDLNNIDSNGIWNDLKLGETKARNMIVNVIGEGSRDDLAAFLRNHYFCICIDESTDCSKEKALAIIVRYLGEDDKIKSEVWDLVKVFEEGKEAKATAGRLYECIENSFAKYNIPLANIYGCCFDGWQTMIGNLSSMLRSANRQHDYANMQKEMGIEQHKILNLSLTRWLSLESNVLRVLEQYPCLLRFSEEKSDDAVANQKKGIIIHKVQEEITKRYKNIVSYFMKREYLISTPAKNIDILNEQEYLRYMDFELGEEIREYFLTTTTDTEEFCTNIYNYLISLSYEMKERFKHFNNAVYESAMCLDPANALSVKFRDENPNIISTLIETFTKLINNVQLAIQIHEGWNNLLSIEIPTEFLATDSPVEEFWVYVRNFTEDDGSMPCEAMGEIALSILAMPHANADPERCFSAQNYVKTKNRNKMKVETVDGTLRSRETVKSTAQNDFIPTEKMIELTLRRRYYKNKFAKSRVS
ncbi:hypothetical protein TSAR_003568 [Trichomalopsis sarcophagae]|uniref:DUF4371 domain-containing protein n=1 Tax=Trichomalopsis sarcophagae TaxID=543379 RepID=A0A232FDN4_9HYME|nr:hypothetical protein TSAR_003568 [Trichomalopsis sarcophagae]